MAGKRARQIRANIQKRDRKRPLFTAEGPALYGKALKHNQRWATHDAPWTTHLSAGEGERFRDWLAAHREDGQNPGGWQPSRKSDYDMRGFWKKYHGTPVANHQLGAHFTDEFKTPYDTTFSAESRYAKPGTPFVWRKGRLVNKRNGRVIYED
jgi:hypothetical protein